MLSRQVWNLKNSIEVIHTLEDLLKGQKEHQTMPTVSKVIHLISISLSKNLSQIVF